MPQELEQVSDKIRILKVDYEAFAKRQGQVAYRIAKDNNLPEDEARVFQRIFGAQVEPEYRLS